MTRTLCFQLLLLNLKTHTHTHKTFFYLNIATHHTTTTQNLTVKRKPDQQFSQAADLPHRSHNKDMELSKGKPK